MTIISRTASTRLTNTGADNLQRVQDGTNASSNQQSAAARKQTRSNKVAQVFPAPGSIFGPPTKIPQYRSDAIIVASIDMKAAFRPGGIAGFNYKYVEGPLASLVTNTRVVHEPRTRTLEGILNEVKAQKRLNHGQALSRITIVTHGDSGRLQLGNSSIFSVSEIVQPIMANGLLKPGGRLVLSGCSIASETQACAELSRLAQKFNIVIQASEVPTSLGRENLAYLTFYPSSKITRNLGPFAPF